MRNDTRKADFYISMVDAGFHTDAYEVNDSGEDIDVLLPHDCKPWEISSAYHFASSIWADRVVHVYMGAKLVAGPIPNATGKEPASAADIQRLESKIDRLIEALAMDDEDGPPMTLEGEQTPANRSENEPL